MSATTPANQKPTAARDSTVDDNQDDSDALLASLENECDEDSAYRLQRIEQLNAELASAKATALQSSTATTLLDPNDTYPTLPTDQSVLDFTTQSHRCVVHFAHPDFTRCAVMDEHLRQLAARHYEVRFARVDVRNAPFVVEKLGIRVLPCVVGFREGVGVERVVGFEGLGAGGKDGTDQISPVILEKRLLWKGVLVRERLSGKDREDGASESEGSDSEDDSRKRRGIRSGNVKLNKGREEDDDDDWD